jgi:hypothetical protein
VQIQSQIRVEVTPENVHESEEEVNQGGVVLWKLSILLLSKLLLSKLTSLWMTLLINY